MFLNALQNRAVQRFVRRIGRVNTATNHNFLIRDIGVNGAPDRTTSIGMRQTAFVETGRNFGGIQREAAVICSCGG